MYIVLYECIIDLTEHGQLGTSKIFVCPKGIIC